MFRSRVRKSKDQKIFRRTAATVKSINLRPSIMRGGFRL